MIVKNLKDIILKIKWHTMKIEKYLDNISYINLNEINMKLDNQLTNDLHLAMVEDRNDKMEKCMKSIKQLKELLGIKER